MVIGMNRSMIRIQRKDAPLTHATRDLDMPVLVCIPFKAFRAPRRPRKSGPEGLNSRSTSPGVFAIHPHQPSRSEPNGILH